MSAVGGRAGWTTSIRSQGVTARNVAARRCSPSLRGRALSLRRSSSAGEALSRPRSGRRDGPGGRRMINAYGPTETTVCATMSMTVVRRRWRCRRSGGRSGTRGFMFWMAAWSRCRRGCGRALHRRGGAGAGLSGTAGLTAERFVADPFGPAGQPDVPHRRPGAVARRRGAGVFGPRRPAGQAPRASASSPARSRRRCSPSRRLRRRR